MPETVKDVLIAARALIADPERWCQENLAQNNCGVGILPNDEDAVCFCALGALARVQNVDEPSLDALADSAATELDNAALRVFGAPQDRFTMIAALNDGELKWQSGDPTECHAQVLRVYDIAIEDNA